MPLTDEQIEALRRAAEERGVDADALIERAESLLEQSESGAAPAPGESPQQPPGGPGQEQREAQLLIGHLPYVKVRELRQIWLKPLGLDKEFPDQELTIAEWNRKHGVPGWAPPAPPQGGNGGSQPSDPDGGE